jgi:hypothetical protein
MFHIICLVAPKRVELSGSSEQAHEGAKDGCPPGDSAFTRLASGNTLVVLSNASETGDHLFEAQAGPGLRFIFSWLSCVRI